MKGFALILCRMAAKIFGSAKPPLKCDLVAKKERLPGLLPVGRRNPL